MFPSFILEFGNYHVEQVLDNDGHIASFNDTPKFIEIWRMSHAGEIWKLLKGIFVDLADETCQTFHLKTLKSMKMNINLMMTMTGCDPSMTLSLT